jgi:hypothetical protein
MQFNDNSTFQLQGQRARHQHVSFLQTIWLYNLGECTLHSHHCENLRYKCTEVLSGSEACQDGMAGNQHATYKYIVAYLLKARTVKPEETTVAR